MEMTYSQRWYVFQAIEEKMFRLDHQIRDIKKLEQNWEIKYHVKNLTEELEQLRIVRNQMQIEIELETK